MWQAINKEMELKECSIYCYSPEDDSYESEEGTIWSFDYFFFNKAKKRVCYVYLRGLSITSDIPVPRTPVSETASVSGDWTHLSSGACKRAKYWLGDRGTAKVDAGRWDEDDDSEIIMSSSMEHEARSSRSGDRSTRSRTAWS